MRARTRMLVRPALLALLLTGIIAVRAVEGYPHDTSSSLHRVVTHPSRYLEDATYSLDDEVSMKQKLNSKRWWKTSGAYNPMAGKFPTADTVDIPSRFSNNGGFLQLCLLLVFCMAVICCASTTINPWYKAGDLHLVRRVAAGTAGAFTFLTNLMFAKLAMSMEGKHGGVGRNEAAHKGPEGKIFAQSQHHSSKKAAKGKKRRTSQTGAHSTAPSVPSSRPTEQAVSNASDDMSSVSMDVELGQGTSVASSEVEAPPMTYMTPADAQIARLEAEAKERELHRLAKQKRNAKSAQIAAKPLEDPSCIGEAENVGVPLSRPKPRDGTRDIASLGKEPVHKHPDIREKPGEHREHAKSRLDRKHVTDVEVKAYAKRAKDFGPSRQDSSRGQDGDIKERPTRKAGLSERNPGNVTQVLVVPRKSLYGKSKPEVQAVLDEQAERHLAPPTPDRGNHRSNSGPSSISSPQSMASPSRPYAEVARETTSKPVWGPAFVPPPPPPPPPPPRKISALPLSAVYAQEFTPASHRLAATTQEMQRSGGTPTAPLSLTRASAPPDLVIPPANVDQGDGMISTPSPFPGMSVHRKRTGLPVTSMYSNVLPNAQSLGMSDLGIALSNFNGRGNASTESDPYAVSAPGANPSQGPVTLKNSTSGFQKLWPVEHGFPGIVDHIWGRSVARIEPSSQWNGPELVSDISLASSSDLGSHVFGCHDPPLLSLGHSSL